ncbi:MAG: B12-binding domain-containing radical SAM protein [Halanaerobiales bacterium]|nr:B12-binding domain-containing radical SAM protein [Halanaerobiales bacterium]
MRVCLINPSIVSDNTINSPLSTRNKYYINPYNLQHIGLGYIAAVLEKADYEVEIIECARIGASVKKVCDLIVKGNYDMVGISTYFFNYMNVVRIISRLRKLKPSIFIFLGGFLPSLSYEMLLNNLDTFECCVIGEGEATTLELVEKVVKGKNWRDTPGIAYREGKEIIFTGKRELIDNLDMLPFPKRQFISERKIVSVLTTRGCYGHCTYCGIQEFFKTCEGKKVRRRTPENVVAEIELLVNNYEIEYITFNDGNFHIASVVGRAWFNRFYELIKEKGIKVYYLCDFRANEVVKSRDILEKFIEIGLYNVNVGIESFLQQQLNFYNKQIVVEENVKTIQILEDLKLRYTIGILLFDPVITVPEIIKFINVMNDMGFYEQDYNIIRPLSIGSTVIATTGTPLFDYVVKEGLYTPNDKNYNFMDIKTDLCYKVVTKWSNRVSPLFNKNFIAYLADENGEEEKYDIIKKVYQKLFKLDMEFIREVCNQIMNDNDGTDFFDLLIEEWKEKLIPLKNQLAGLEEYLLKYY